MTGKSSWGTFPGDGRHLKASSRVLDFMSAYGRAGQLPMVPGKKWMGGADLGFLDNIYCPERSKKVEITVPFYSFAALVSDC